MNEQRYCNSGNSLVGLLSNIKSPNSISNQECFMVEIKFLFQCLLRAKTHILPAGWEQF
jgi:hypothetical protein